VPDTDSAAPVLGLGPEELLAELPRLRLVQLMSAGAEKFIGRVPPVAPETTGMADAAFLAAMRDDALLVNAARGVVVDTDALLAELTSGRLRAALDVTEPEPLPAGHPLWSAPDLLLTPHVGGAVPGAGARANAAVTDQLRRVLAGEPLQNVVRAY
jgi:phosphoglycerate dehydrogenase-like enzyme